MAALAGPSRLPLRSLHTARVLFASPPSQTPNLRSTKVTSSPSRPTTIISRTTAIPPPVPAQRGRISWPWRPLPSSDPNTVEEERTIFARPFDGRPRMYWFSAAIWTVFFGWFISMPDSSRPADEGKDEISQTPQGVLWKYAAGGLMVMLSVMGFGFMLYPSRLVTRLSQVRVRSRGETREFIRMTHGGHLMMWGKYAKPRELQKEHMKVRVLGSINRSPYLDLRIREPRRNLLDGTPYRLDFRDNRLVKETEEEVVLSLNRIEEVFGEL
ncbi:hypothetical protein P7C73_g2054, partial [Tremellales sp. Uapishka_1]